MTKMNISVEVIYQCNIPEDMTPEELRRLKIKLSSLTTSVMGNVLIHGQNKPIPDEYLENSFGEAKPEVMLPGGKHPIAPLLALE